MQRPIMDMSVHGMIGELKKMAEHAGLEFVPEKKTKRAQKKVCKKGTKGGKSK